MKKFCCFAGHNSYYGDDIKEKVKSRVIRLIEEENVTNFLVGNYGNFDALCAGVIRELKESYDGLTLELVLPYITKEVNEHSILYKGRYDTLLMADIPPSTPARLRIIMANRYMVDKSSFLICHINRSWGGAAMTLEYAAKKKHITVINISEPLQPAPRAF